MIEEVTNDAAICESAWSQVVALRNHGKKEEAISLLRQLLSRYPKFVVGARGLAELLAETNQIDEAILGFQYVLSLDPNQADSALKLGVLLATHNQLSKAAECFRHTIRIQPDSAVAHRYLGMVLSSIGAYPEAIEAFQTAIGLDPTITDAFMSLGDVFSKLQRYEDSEKCYSTAVGLDPNNPMPYVSLGTCVANQNRLEEALSCFWKAIAIDPKCMAAHINAGIAYESTGQLEDALRAFQTAIDVSPEHYPTYVNLGVIYDRLGEFEKAEQCFQKTLSMEATYIPAIFNLGMMQLRNGDWVRGLQAYELRTQLPGAKKLETQKPRWNGESLAGKTILVLHEQGMGDCIQFVRYTSLLKERGARVLLNCRRSMRSLLVTCDGVDEFFPIGEALPFHDFYIPLMSLPLAFETTTTNVPHHVPYLHADPERVLRWKERLAKDSGYKIGITWRGNPTYASDRYRSIDVKLFQSLSDLGNIQFYNLQKEDVRDDIQRVADSIRIHNFGDELDRQSAFVDTAALMQCLDLVISVDTAPAHLAGATGVPVWLIVSYNNDWRWLTHRTDTPWYPTMRIYRQDRTKDWISVFERLAVDLEQRILKG